MPASAAIREAQERAARDNREYRYLTTPVELRAADGAAEQRLVGHAAVFNVEQTIGPSDDPYWIEVIAPGAFRNSILNDDVRALFNHDDNWVLGRTKAGTCKLEEDAIGLLSNILLDDTTAGTDVRKYVKRGDVTQMSFGFRTKKQQWEEMPGGRVKRTLLEVELWDVSPVTYPAYPATDVALREARSAGLIVMPAAVDARSLTLAQKRLAFAERGI